MFIPTLGMLPLASPWIIPRDSGAINEKRYATLLSRRARVAALFQCTDAQSERYAGNMSYDAHWLLMRATALSTLATPTRRSRYVVDFLLFTSRHNVYDSSKRL